MIQISQKQIFQRYDELSPILRGALFSGENANTIYYLSKENQLTDEQMDNLSKIAGNIILGFTDIKNLQQQIKNELKIDDLKSQTIARELNSRIFSSLKMEINYTPVEAEIETKKNEPVAFSSASQPSAMPYAPIQKSFRDFIPRKPGSRNSVASPENNLTEFTLPGKPGEPIPETKKETQKKPTIDLQTFEIKDANSAPSEMRTRPYENIPANPEPAVPFMLHQENGAAATLPTGHEKPTPKFSIKPELEIKVQDYYQTPPEPKKSPISVKIETPHTNSAPPPAASETRMRPYESQKITNSAPPATNLRQPESANTNNMRVVHYGGFRTPINNLGYAKDMPRTDENTIDLRKFSR